MKIAMRRGHQRTGSDGCAEGLVNEIDVAEDYYRKAMDKFRELGHEVLDCTPPEANRSVSDSLYYGINKANNWGADIFISCHANNAYKDYNGVIGCEVIYHRNSVKGLKYATSVERKLSAAGFKSRGPKADVRGLAEINKTNMPAIIVEPFFVEATGDVEVYRRIGGEGIANAIVEGITGQVVSNRPVENKPVELSSYTVKVTTDVLNVRAGAGTNYKITTQVRRGEVYTIVEESNGWGKLKSGAGWICLEYTSKNSKPTQTIKVGSKVKVTGSRYATGQSIPSWVKESTYTVQQISGEKALITEITSWVYTKDLKAV